MTGSLKGAEFAITSDYVEAPSVVYQGSFSELPVKRDADKIIVALKASPPQGVLRDHGTASLSEIEIYVGGGTDLQRSVRL